MLKLYFTTNEHPAYAKTTYSQRERLRKDKILMHRASINEWVERSHLAVESMDQVSQMMYAVQHFTNAYPLDGCGLCLYADKNPKGVSKDSYFYSYRDTLDDGITKEEIETIKGILSLGVLVAVEEVLEHRAPDMDYLIPDASTNPCWWWKRVYRYLNENMNKGKFSHLTEWNQNAIKLSCSMIITMLGGHSWSYTDVAKITLDFENYLLKQIRGSIENYEWYVTTKWHMNKDNLLSRYSLTDEEIEEAKNKRDVDLVDIRAKEKAEADRINSEMEEHREYCRAMERLRDARMEAYDRACDKAGCALPWMF